MRKLKDFLKQFYWVRFLNVYSRFIFFKIFYSTTRAREKYIKKKFKEKLGYEIDFNKVPETFNQKIQFRKLYDNNPLYSICADKYRVREYVKEKIGEQYLIPLYLVTDKLTEEQWDQLPNSFVAKANHNSGPVQIIKDKSKVNKKEIIRELNNQLKLDYGILSMEKYYSDIPRKIIVEKLLIDTTGDIPKDYKFHVFNSNKGNKLFLEVHFDRLTSHKKGIYDEDLKQLNFSLGTFYPKYEKKIEVDNFSELKEVALKIAKEFEYVRVDLYQIENKIYIGELTFCPFSGLEKFEPKEWDYKFGNYWNKK